MTTNSSSVISLSDHPLNKDERSLHIGSTVLLMTFLTLIGQCLGLVRESTIAAKFGASILTDSFLLAILVPNAILLLIQSGLSMAFIPVLTNILATEGEERVWQVAINLMNWLFLAMAFFSVIILVSADSIVTIIAPRISPDAHILTVRLLRLLVLVDVFGEAMILLTGVLNVYRVYTIPNLFGLVLNGTIIIGVIFFSGLLSIYALATSTIAAYALQGFLLLFALRKLRRFRFLLNPREKVIFHVLCLSWPVMLTLLFQQAIVLADRVIAVRLGIGSVAALNFSANMVLIGASLLVGALSTIILPELSHIIASGDWERAKSLASSVLRFTAFAAIPAATMLFVLRRPIAILIFKRGAFTEAATDLTAGAIGFYAIGLVAISLREIVVRFFYASRDMRVPLITGGLRMVINLVLDIILSLFLGINGIALAYTVAVSLDALLMLIVFARRWRMPFNPLYMLKMSIATLAILLVTSLVHHFNSYAQSIPGQFYYLQLIFTSGIAGGLAYWGVCILLNISESKTILSFGLNQVKLARLRIRGGVQL